VLIRFDWFDPERFLTNVECPPFVRHAGRIALWRAIEQTNSSTIIRNVFSQKYKLKKILTHSAFDTFAMGAAPRHHRSQYCFPHLLMPTSPIFAIMNKHNSIALSWQHQDSKMVDDDYDNDFNHTPIKSGGVSFKWGARAGFGFAVCPSSIRSW
jgi:hypothetical protein